MNMSRIILTQNKAHWCSQCQSVSSVFTISSVKFHRIVLGTKHPNWKLKYLRVLWRLPFGVTDCSRKKTGEKNIMTDNHTIYYRLISMFKINVKGIKWLIQAEGLWFFLILSPNIWEREEIGNIHWDSMTFFIPYFQEGT